MQWFFRIMFGLMGACLGSLAGNEGKDLADRKQMQATAVVRQKEDAVSVEQRLSAQ